LISLYKHYWLILLIISLARLYFLTIRPESLLDILFSPSTPASNLETLGLLGRLAATPAIFEPFRNAASSF
jgi:hypothetical protein